MFKRLIVTLIAMGLLAQLTASQVLAQGSIGVTKINFIMPTGVDPPTSEFMGREAIKPTSTELATGINLYGRSLDIVQNINTPCTLQYQDITSIKIQFTSTKPVTVTTSVTTILPFVPWTSQVSRSGNIWTVILTAAPGSAPMSSWDVDGLGHGFFAALTATDGTGPASISNIIITPLQFVVNTNQRSSSGVVDLLGPTINGSVDKPVIWQPNGQAVRVNVTGTMVDNPTENDERYISGVDPCSVQATLTYTDGGPSSAPVPVPIKVAFRANGSATFAIYTSLAITSGGNSLAGRIYTFHITANDMAGNPAQMLDIPVLVSP